MANADASRGLQPVNTGGAGTFSGKVTKYHVASTDSTAIYVGGLVKLSGTGDANGVPGVTGNVSTGDAVVGVMVGAIPNTRDSAVYREASVDRYILVADDPNQVFEIQDDSVGGDLAVTNIGNTADLTGFTGGSTTTGLSSMEIDSSTATASGDGTEDVLILGLAQREDNSIGTNANWLVRLNNHQFVDGVAGA